MDEREFIDTLYSGWSKTTNVEGSYWQPVELVNVPGRYKIYAVTVDAETKAETRKLVATFLSEGDVSFITGIHGAFGDVCRRVQEAYDEADRLDDERDSLMCRIAELEITVDQKKTGLRYPTSGRDGAEEA